MDIKTAIEIEFWGDYDQKYTDSVMVSTEKHNVNKLVEDYCSLMGLESTSGLPNNMLNDFTEEFKKYLTKLGFTTLKTKTVCFSD